MSGSGQEYEERKLEVAAALRELERCVGELSRALAHAEVTIRVEGTNDPKEAVRLVAEGYAAMDFVEDGDDKPPQCVLGVVGVPFHVKERARAVNDAKGRFETACNKLWDRRMSATVKDRKGRPLVKKMPWVRLMLRELGRPRLSMIAACRRIRILDEAPLKVRFHKVRTRSVYKRARADLIEALSESSRVEAAEDLARLRRLPPSERYLGEVREYFEHHRAHVTLPFEPKDGDKVTKRKQPKTMREQFGAAMPLLYERDRGKPDPVVRFPGEGGPQRHAGRPRKLQEHAFLRTMAIHRYADPADARYK